MTTTTTHQDRFTDAERMEVRSYVNLAGEVVTRLWPMRTFISRNPLQGLEHLRFGKAVLKGEHLFSGNGYLSEALYREEFQKGHIQLHDLNRVLQPLASDKRARFGDRDLTHLEVMRTALIHELHAVGKALGATQPESTFRQSEDVTASVQQWLEQTQPSDMWNQREGPLPYELDAWPSHEGMATWCDRTLGTRVTEQIDQQMIKWCAAFCDEGEAAWSMPHREQTFFRAWKASAQYDLELRCLGIVSAAEKIRLMPDRPEEALLQSLNMLKVPKAAWQEYLALHVAALPGWTGFIKWRSDQTAYPWQEAYRIDLTKYLAVRLFYERELVAVACRKYLQCDGNFQAVLDLSKQYPHAVWLRRALTSGILPEEARSETARLRRWWTRSSPAEWNELGLRWYDKHRLARQAESLSLSTRMIVKLADALSMPPEAITASSPSDLTTLINWLRAFAPRQRAQKWLEATELTDQTAMLQQLTSKQTDSNALSPAQRGQVRPLAQFAFCIDVRSEVLRRHLELRSGYETFGFAGFFGVAFAYRSLDEPHETELCPVLIKPKHMIREVPRAYQDEAARKRKSSAMAAKAGRELLHDLKHNVITPYVMVEAIGWFFAWPLFGKTFFPGFYHRLTTWVKNKALPSVATTLTVDKLTSGEANEMVAAEQRMQILRWLRAHHQIQGERLNAHILEGLRSQALDATTSGAATEQLGRLLAVSGAQEATFLDALRQECHLTPRDTSARVARLTRTGFTENEQAYYVETALRLMGMTSSFGRLIFVCAHGSTSDNNPYESALDCGACGGSHGLPNARAFATIANKPKVRELLAQRGITIPPDTYFVAALHDTTTDLVRVTDLEDFPSTHRKELGQVLEDVSAASYQAAAERQGRLAPAAAQQGTPHEALQAARTRSHDWSQVRPEWGLAGNAFFIIASRRWTQGTDLEGQAFLHSYDYATDEDGRLLEFIMTAPLIVAQWINMEYYFSTVDPGVYGSGSKIYHNVTGRIGVMSGNQSDLRMGLPVQTVMDGTRPYHRPKRLTALIEAPRERIMAIIKRQPLLEKLLDNQWLRLVALDPQDGATYSYDPIDGWRK